MNDLNLLLRKQTNIKEKITYISKNPDLSDHEEVSSNAIAVPRKDVVHLENQCEKIKMELANIQTEESSALEQHRTLWESYNLLEIVAENITNHIECLLLDIKSTSRLSSWLNSYAVHEQYITNNISINLKKLNEHYESSTLNKIRAKLVQAFNNDDALAKLHDEFRCRQSNYKLALKNFKIILEILNVNEDSLRKLKQQFDEVLMDYQHCRCILDHELPFAIAEGTKVLEDCLSLLGNEYDVLTDRREALRNLLKDIGQKMRANEYILVKTELVSSRSDDNNI